MCENRCLDRIEVRVLSIPFFVLAIFLKSQHLEYFQQ